MAEEIKQHEMVRYESSLDLQDAWLKAVNMNIGDLANIWKESILVLRKNMLQQDDLGVSFKSAQVLSRLLPDMVKAYADVKQTPQRGSTIDVQRNPFGDNGSGQS